MSIRLSLASLMLALAACMQPSVIGPGSTVGADKVDWQAAQSPGQCAAIGGAWQPICMMQKPACVVQYKDAGKSCSDSSQCSGKCVTTGGGARPDQPANGICTSSSDPCGCSQLVENGKAGYPLCAD